MLLESEKSAQVLPPNRARVVIADDDPIARQVIEHMIDNEESLELVGTANGVDGLIRLTLQLDPDVVVVDWAMPDGGGLTATQQILGKRPMTKVVAFTSSDGPTAMVEMLRAGARDVIVKGCPAATLTTSIQRAIAA